MVSEQNLKKVVVLGTGGTIAGTAQKASDNIGYTAAQVGVAQLLAEVPGMAEVLAGRAMVNSQASMIRHLQAFPDVLCWLQRVVVLGGTTKATAPCALVWQETSQTCPEAASET